MNSDPLPLATAEVRPDAGGHQIKRNRPARRLAGLPGRAGFHPRRATALFSPCHRALTGINQAFSNHSNPIDRASVLT
jgi:hypothetical protein